MKFTEYITEKASFFDKDADYIIREVRAGTNEYEVTKWIKGKNPDEIYRCYHNKANNKWSCSCPTRSMPCKHVKMVKDWISKGKKPFIDDKDAIEYAKKMFKEAKCEHDWKFQGEEAYLEKGKYGSAVKRNFKCTKCNAKGYLLVGRKGEKDSSKMIIKR